ncbi:MAG: GNAT family N-acetyltransferase [Thermoplasmatota archaeon]
MAVTIRRLQDGDVDGLCRLWGDFARLREGMTARRILNDDAADYFFGYATGLLQRKDTLTLIAEDAATHVAVGYLIATKQRRPPIYHHTRVAYLSDTFIAEGFRKQGILKRLIDELLAWCKAEGITAIDVQIFEGNKEAVEIYRHLGFNDYRLTMRLEVVPAPMDAEKPLEL